MKKIMVAAWVVSAGWTTSSVAQFQEHIKMNILLALGRSNIEALDQEQFRFIVQDAVDKTMPKALAPTSKLDLVGFLYESQVISEQSKNYFIKVFSPKYQGSRETLTEATEKLKSYFTNLAWREKIIGGLNKQIGNAIVYAYQSAMDARKLASAEFTRGVNRVKISSAVQNTEAGKIFLATANQYFDDTVQPNKTLSAVEDLLVERILMKSNTLVARTTSDHAENILHVIIKLF